MGRRSVIHQSTHERTRVRHMIISALNNTRFPNRQELSGSRWAEWAKSFANRFLLGPVHQQRMTVVLRMPHGRAENVFFVSRWGRFIQQLTPRIHLAVSSLLRELVLRRGPVSPSVGVAIPALGSSLYPPPGEPALTKEEGVHAGSYGMAMGGGISPVQTSLRASQLVR